MAIEIKEYVGYDIKKEAKDMACKTKKKATKTAGKKKK